MIDLHQHSCYSDGTDSVEDLINKNIIVGNKIMALTDHDTINGAKYVIDNNLDRDIKFIPGIEFSTDDSNGQVHILAYNYDMDNPEFLAVIEKSMRLRISRVNKRLELLEKEFGIKLPDRDISDIKNKDNPNKVEIALKLIKNGYGSDIDQVIAKYLYHKLNQEKVTTEEVVSMLTRNNIISCLAHPLGGAGEKRVDIDTLLKRLDRLTKLGLKAMECYYSLYTDEEIKLLIEIAHKYNLLISGGSDYHGKNKSVCIGELGVNRPKVSTEDITILKELMK